MVRPFARALLVCLLAVTLTDCTASRRRSGQVRIRASAITDAPTRFVFFDLGQADGLLVLNEGKTLLIDAGESRERSDSDRFHVIGEVLEQLTGRRHLDGFLVTHYHRDHLGDPSRHSGLWGLFDDGVTVGTLYDRGSDIYGSGGKGDVQRDYETWVPQWLSSGKAKAHHVLKLGETIDLGPGLVAEVVAVNGNGRLTGLLKTDPGVLEAYPPSENDYSVALKFTAGDFELFTGGDLTGSTSLRDFRGHPEGYHDIESSVAQRVGDVEVYRANHHGSRHSSNACFLKVLRPEVSVISSGENSYGHPTPRVFEALTGYGRVFITSGSDPKVREKVRRSVVGDHVVISVERGGKRYSVNGRDYAASDEAQEAAVPDRVQSCVEQPVPDVHAPNQNFSNFPDQAVDGNATGE